MHPPAKKLLYGTLDVGPPAGPSESIILADAATDPDTAATDLLIEAEHGPPYSAALLVTSSAELANKVAEIVPKKVEALPEKQQGGISKPCFPIMCGLVILTDTMEGSDRVS